jgi:hypothetical protein
MPALEDLPAIKISPLRAAGVIRPEMTHAIIELPAGPELPASPHTIALSLLVFPNGGSWSFFICPHCGRQARTLRLLENTLHCPDCLRRRGIRTRATALSLVGRAEARIPVLRAMLNSPTHLRVNPHLRYSKMERRKRFEARLARCEDIVAQARFKRRLSHPTPYAPTAPQS